MSCVVSRVRWDCRLCQDSIFCVAAFSVQEVNTCKRSKQQDFSLFYQTRISPLPDPIDWDWGFGVRAYGVRRSAVRRTGSAYGVYSTQYSRTEYTHAW